MQAKKLLNRVGRIVKLAKTLQSSSLKKFNQTSLILLQSGTVFMSPFNLTEPGERMKDGELTEAEKKWLDKFKHFMKTIPKGLELILVSNGTIEVYPGGTIGKHLGSEHDGFGLSANPEVEGTLITTIKCEGMIPYSEGN